MHAHIQVKKFSLYYKHKMQPLINIQKQIKWCTQEENQAHIVG